MHNSKTALKFEENCLKQDKVSFTHRNVGKVSIVFELGTLARDSNVDFILGDCLVGAVKWNKNNDLDK